MAQTKTKRPVGAEGIGGFDKLKFGQLNIANTAAETTLTVTPADMDMAGFAAWMATVQLGAGVCTIIPTYTANLATSLALTFTAGAEIDLFLIGV